jgi:TonB family protein
LTDDPRLDDSGNDPFERTPLTSPDNRRAPVSTSEQDSASAPAGRKCESCGRPIAAATLCAGCEQAFQHELTSDDAPIDLQAISTSQLDELFAAIEEAQARPKPPAEPALPAVADAIAPAGMPAAADVPYATAYAQTHAPVPMAEPTPELPIATLPPIAVPKPEPFVLPQDVAEAEPQYKPIALKPQPAPVSPAIQPDVVMTELAAASRPAVAVPLPVHATPEPAAAPEPTASREAVTVTAAAAPLEAAPASPFADKKPAASFMPRAAGRLKRFATVAAAVVAVAAIGLPLTKLWLGRQQTIVAQKPQPPAKPAPRTAAPAAAPAVKPAVDRAAAPASAVAPKAAPTTAAPSAPAPAAPRVTAPAAARVTSQAPAPAARAAVRPKPAMVPAAAPQRAAANPPAASASRSTAKPVRPSKPAPPAIASAPVVESGPVALFETAQVAPVPPPAPTAPESPIGPFYESTDVDKTPQVLARVEPELSAELMTRARGEIVVVRFLVTQTGRPVLVSLLRRSKAGMDLDEAVIAAIKNWTFAPAIKRGRAVSCFVHLGVPIGR